MKVFPDDLFLVSYPRSGNTWIRSIAAHLVCPHEDPLPHLDECIPDIYAVPRRTLQMVPRPRVLKSHEYFDPRYRRAIYVVRDPRDVAVSYYHYEVMRSRLPPDASLDEFVVRFVAGRVDLYGRWSDHVRGWLDARQHDRRFLLLRYEDLLSDVAAGVRQIARFVGSDASHDRVQWVSQACSVSSMRAAEADGRLLSEWPRRPGSSFLRSGTSGAGYAELRPESLQLIEDAFAHELQRTGYLP